MGSFLAFWSNILVGIIIGAVVGFYVASNATEEVSRDLAITNAQLAKQAEILNTISVQIAEGANRLIQVSNDAVQRSALPTAPNSSEGVLSK